MGKMVKSHALKNVYGIEEIDEDNLDRLVRSVLIIVGGDGEVSEEEMDAFRDFCRRVGLNDQQLAMLALFDWKQSKLADNLPADLGDGWKNILISEAVTICSADGEYHPDERAKVRQAAETMGVHRGVVAAIEAMVGTELAMREIKRRKLFLFF
jgi:uncharacterized tellurite resistance protein B-like protein